uniref:Secretory carrier-associated membrane protein n=1 Tax=Athene cunicularia TaxID=194338 RepID=A0A663N3A7_ATHCN
MASSCPGQGQAGSEEGFLCRRGCWVLEWAAQGRGESPGSLGGLKSRVDLALTDSSFNFFVFFFVFFAQNVMYVLQAIGIPNWGFSGWILSLIALRKNTAVAVMMILVSLFFTAVPSALFQIHSLYRRTGASFQKAQEEFAAGVFSNQAVRTAAANAAAGAATNAFRATSHITQPGPFTLCSGRGGVLSCPEHALCLC